MLRGRAGAGQASRQTFPSGGRRGAPRAGSRRVAAAVRGAARPGAAASVSPLASGALGSAGRCERPRRERRTRAAFASGRSGRSSVGKAAGRPPCGAREVKYCRNFNWEGRRGAAGPESGRRRDRRAGGTRQGASGGGRGSLACPALWLGCRFNCSGFASFCLIVYLVLFSRGQPLL